VVLYQPFGNATALAGDKTPDMYIQKIFIKNHFKQKNNIKIKIFSFI
jgi:hypothetical protein